MAIFMISDGWMRVKPSGSQRLAPLTGDPEQEHGDQQQHADDVQRNGETHQLLWRQARDEPHDDQARPMLPACESMRSLPPMVAEWTVASPTAMIARVISSSGKSIVGDQPVPAAFEDADGVDHSSWSSSTAATSSLAAPAGSLPSR
jgi:hypothetical protein